jgi:hypothetical protein
VAESVGYDIPAEPRRSRREHTFHTNLSSIDGVYLSSAASNEMADEFGRWGRWPTMNLDYVPLLRVMRELQSIPRGQPTDFNGKKRFRQYLRTIFEYDRKVVNLLPLF